MPFREGDIIAVQLGDTYIRLDLPGRIELTGIVLDGEEEGALRYLVERIFPALEGAEESAPEQRELHRIVAEKDGAAALKYLAKTIYPRVDRFIHRTGCKPVFELPFGNAAASFAKGRESC